MNRTTNKTDKLPEGVTLVKGLYWDEYTGTGAALVAGGIVRSDQLPGVPGATRKRGATFVDGVLCRTRYSDGLGNRWMRISAERTPGSFRVCFGVHWEERARREEEQKAALQAAQEAKRTQLDADPDTLRFQAVTFLRCLRKLLADHTPGDHEHDDPISACRFSPEGISDALEALQDVADWIDGATIKPPKKGQPQGLAAAASDKSFQAFLRAQCLGGDHD